MAQDEYPYKCSICCTMYRTATELDYHNKGHGTPSDIRPQSNKPKRVRRKAMSVEGFARFKYSLAIAISHAMDEFDPTAVELQLALSEIGAIISVLKNITTRKTQ